MGACGQGRCREEALCTRCTAAAEEESVELLREEDGADRRSLGYFLTPCSDSHSFDRIIFFLDFRTATVAWLGVSYGLNPRCIDWAGRGLRLLMPSGSFFFPGRAGRRDTVRLAWHGMYARSYLLQITAGTPGITINGGLAVQRGPLDIFA